VLGDALAAMAYAVYPLAAPIFPPLPSKLI
jgi:hypothetical protein